MKRHLILLVSTLALLGSSAFAQTVPDRINYQGNVKTSSGPVGAGTAVTRPITFKFYKVATGGTAADVLWTEIQQVSILDGNFSVLLGSGSGVPANTNTGTFQAVFANTSLYLGITVDVDNVASNDTEITPRQQLVTTAFAFRAGVAAKVDDAAVTGTMIAASAVSTAQLGANAVTAEKIATSAVTTTQILDGSIGVNDLGTGSVTTAKILDGTVATADIADSAVTTAKQADSSITTAKILDATIVTADMADAAVTTAKIADGAATSAKILDGTIATADLADNSVTAAKIVNATVTGADIAAGTITDANLGTNTATTVENLRMVRGTVTIATGTGASYTGLITTGSGYTTVVNGAYVQINFTPPFSAPPTILVSNFSSAGWAQYVVRNGVDSPTASQFKTSCSLSGISGNGDTVFSGHGNGLQFIAIGPR